MVLTMLGGNAFIRANTLENYITMFRRVQEIRMIVVRMTLHNSIVRQAKLVPVLSGDDFQNPVI